MKPKKPKPKTGRPLTKENPPALPETYDYQAPWTGKKPKNPRKK